MSSMDDDFYEFNHPEAWEAPARMWKNKDYAGYLDYCERHVARHPDDLQARDRLCGAYIMNEQYEKAIRAAGAIHREHPDFDGFKHHILDALFALGKSEDDFDWVEPPVVLRIDRDLLDDIHYYLRPKRKPRTVEMIRLGLMSEGYVAFSSEEFVRALEGDGRFVVQVDEFVRWSTVRVRRKKDG